jgi:hypothetical protein
MVSPGKASTDVCPAPVSTTSGIPLSLTSPSVKKRVVPIGAARRLHQLPNESRYPVLGHGGSVINGSGMTRSWTREKWMFNIKFIGVVCEQS